MRGSRTAAAAAAVWVLAAALLVASRLLVVPGQPWEQDEALFAAASFELDLAARRPHPPGFPLWVAAGAAGRVLFGDPLLALQLLSALASLLTVLLLARLWGAALGDRTLGGVAALLYGFAPAVWFHAPRAFTDTPAVCLAAAAAAAWCRPGRGALLTGAAAFAGALLVRPLLAPPLAVLAVAAVALRRDRPREVALAAALVAVLLVAGFLPLVVDAGGLPPFAAAVREHASDHLGALDLAPWRLAGLGPVKGVGGLLPALAVLLLTGAWWLREVRVAPTRAWWWLALTVTTAAWLLLAHNRTYPRYSVPLLALLAGPAVAGLERVVRARWLVLAGAVTAAAAAGAWTWPAVRAQATQPFPPLAALAAAATSGSPGAVVVDGGLSPFTDLLVLARAAPRPPVWRPLLAAGRIGVDDLRGPWTFVWSEGTTPAFVPAPGLPHREHRCDSPRLRQLAQGRHLACWTSDRGAIVLEPRAPRLRRGGGVHVDDAVTLLLQPTPPGSFFGALLSVTGGAVELELEGHRGGPHRGRLEVGRHPVHLPLERGGPAPATRPTVVVLRSLGGDGRVTLERVWVDPADGRFTPEQVTAAEQAEGLDGLVTTAGFFPVERLGDRPGRWSGAHARLSLPAGDGRMVLELLAPRPEPALVRLVVPELGFATTVRVGARWHEVAIPVTPPRGRVTLELEVANPFVPATTVPGAGDRRELGVVVGQARFEAASASP